MLPRDRRGSSIDKDKNIGWLLFRDQLSHPFHLRPHSQFQEILDPLIPLNKRTNTSRRRTL
jgi:hypothetical protein